MRYCALCGEPKEDHEFRHNPMQGFTSRCIACRALVRAQRAGHAAVSKARIEESRRRFREEIAAHRLDWNARGANIRLIRDANVARDLAWVFENNPGLGRS